jgi:NADP-reducing hydrogenase subunit HndA
MTNRKPFLPFHREQLQEKKLKEIIAEHKDVKGSLIPVLQKAQALYGYLPIEVQSTIARGLNLPLAHVSSVVSFYNFITSDKCGKYLIRICKSAPCHIQASALTQKAFENILKIKAGETTPDGKFTLVTCQCLGICDRAPAVMINDMAFGLVLPQDVTKILAYFD